MHKLLIASVAILFTTSCSQEEGSILETPSRAAGSIVIASQDTQHLGVTRYNLSGAYQELIATYRGNVNSIPRGLALRDHKSILVGLDGEDGIEELSFGGTASVFYASALVSGNIYDLESDAQNNYYLIESNRIERFDVNGNRTNPTYINTNVGACSLSNPRHMTINANGNLVVAQTGGGGRILTYDISSDTATCISSVVFGNTPYAVVSHSNGRLYVGTQGDDQIYEADPDGSNRVSIWATDTAIINNPGAMTEHPDGSLLISSTGTGTIEKLQIDGTRVGTEPFIRDLFSRNIHDILVIPENNL